MGGEGLMMRKFAMEKWDEDMGGANNFFNSITENLKMILLMLHNFGVHLVGKLDEVFPPESREKLLQWIKVGAPYVVTGLLLIICVWFCWIILVKAVWFCWNILVKVVCFCWNILVNAVRCICSCCLPGATTAVKMMKAPGMVGVVIVRSVFESNPAAYFSALRV